MPAKPDPSRRKRSREAPPRKAIPSSNGVEAWSSEELEAHNRWQWQEHIRAFPSSDTGVDEHVRRFEEASLTTAGVKALKPSPRLIAGYLYQDSLARIYGPPGSSKTFLTLDWVLSIASTEDTGWWHDSPLVGGPVVYVVAEGARGFSKRLNAYETHHENPRYFHNVTWLPLAVNLFNDKEARGFARWVERLEPMLVVFDTLARCSLGADENSSRDAGAVIANMDVIRRATSACVLTVHHTGYDESHGRGSTAYLGALDTELELKDKNKDGLHLLLNVPKQKDQAETPTLHLARVEVEGTNSCVVVTSSASLEEEAVLNKGDMETLEVLRRIQVPGGVSPTTWQKSCECASRTFYYHRGKLVEGGHVQNLGTEDRPKYVVAEEP